MPEPPSAFNLSVSDGSTLLQFHVSFIKLKRRRQDQSANANINCHYDRASP